MIKSLSQNGNKTVGEQIRELRTERGLTIKGLSIATGFSSAAISRWESGKRIPSVESFNKMMKALDAEIIVIENN